MGTGPLAYIKMHLQCKTITPWVLKHPILTSVFVLADICIIMPNAHKTLHQKKVAPCLHSSLSFGKNSLFLHSLELPRTTCNLPVNIILSSFGTRPLSLPLPLPFSLACEGSLSHSETSKYYFPRVLRLFLPLPRAATLVGRGSWMRLSLYGTSFSNVHRVHIPPCLLPCVRYKTPTPKGLLNWTEKNI